MKAIKKIKAKLDADDLDDIIKNTCGGVLNPLLTDRTGVALLEESDNEVSAAMAVSDLDVASTYSGALH